MRCFIAIDFPEEIKSELIRVQELLPKELAKFRLTGKEQLHLTIKFIGEVQPEKVARVKEILKKIRFKPFRGALSEIGVFPSGNYIRVVWAGLKPEGGFIELQQKIEKALEEEFKKEKNFHPHITLARVKFVEDTKEFIEKIKKIKMEGKEFAVEDFKLKKSTPTGRGSVYEDVDVFGN